MGSSWGHLGPSRGHLGATLEPIGVILGPSWGQLGSILGPSWVQGALQQGNYELPLCSTIPSPAECAKRYNNILCKTLRDHANVSLVVNSKLISRSLSIAGGTPRSEDTRRSRKALQLQIEEGTAMHFQTLRMHAQQYSADRPNLCAS